jgi:hypothetical protein
MPRGIARSGSFTSWPISDVISKPENPKHMADQRLIVLSTSSRGQSSDGAKEVAEPNRASAIAPNAISSAAGTNVA